MCDVTNIIGNDCLVMIAHSFSWHCWFLQHKEITLLEEWIEDNIRLDHHDILAEVFRTGKTKHVFRDEIDQKKYDINAPNSMLNLEVYEQYNHHTLD